MIDQTQIFHPSYLKPEPINNTMGILVLLRAENFYMEYCLVSSCSFNPQETYVLCHTAHGNVVGFTLILSFCPMVNYINSNLMLNHHCISVMSSTVMMDSLYIYKLCALIFIHKFIFLCCSYLIWCQICIGLLQIKYCL